MRREAGSISSAQIEGMIQSSAKERGVDLNEQKNQIISEIMSTAPAEMKPKGMTDWCKSKVEEALQKHPELREEADQIRSDVRKEALFVMHKEEFEELRSKLSQKEVVSFSPEDVKRIMPSFFTKISRLYSSNNGKVDWEWVANKIGLGDKLERLRIDGRDIPASTQELLSLLEEKKPESFSSTWIHDNNNALYQALCRRLTTKFGINWQVVIDGLPEEWRKKWSSQNEFHSKVKNVNLRLQSSRGKKTIQELASELSAKLREDKPETFNPGYFSQPRYNSTYDYLRRYAYDDSGKIDWDLVIGLLPKDLQEKWRRPKPRYEDHAPQKHYESTEEVDQALEPYRDKLYVLVQTSNLEDRKIKDNIISDLIQLAQRGNDAAKERVMEYLKFSISEWIDNGKLPSVLLQHEAEVLNRTERAIYLHKEKKAFLVYLQVNLKMMAKGWVDQVDDLNGDDVGYVNGRIRRMRSSENMDMMGVGK